MRFILKLSLLSLLISVLSACNPAVKPEELPESIQTGGIYYTQVAMHFEKNHFSSTNYGVGELLPVNTRMKFIEMKEKYFVVEELDTHRQLKFSNNPHHTHETTIQAFEKLFGQQAVDIKQFSEMEQRNIEKGTFEVGMSKAAVILARGYPPAIGTSSLNSNQWKYWWNKWTTLLVKFENDHVIEITEAARE